LRKLTNIELNRPNLKEFKSLKKSNIILVLDNIRSAHNVGSIFRSSDAFKVQVDTNSGLISYDDDIQNKKMVNIPYCMKLLLQEIESFGIKPTVYTNDKNDFDDIYENVVIDEDNQNIC